MRIFISHSSHDAETAVGICSVLEGEGHSCFIAPRDIRPGREYAEEIINGILDADALLLLLSERANQSPHVLREVERAGSSRIPVIVYKLEEVGLTKSLEYFLMTNQWIDGAGDSDYRKVAEAFESQPDLWADLPDRDQSDKRQLKRNQPKQESRKKGGQSAVKRMIPTLVLLLVIAAIVFAVSKAGHVGSVTADSGRQEQNDRMPDAGGSIQSADNGILDANGRMQNADNGTPDADIEAQKTDNETQTAAGADTGTLAAETVDLSPGTSVELGTYGGEPIVWRVLRVSEDEAQLILVSDKILTMKAFDAAESGKYNSNGDKDYWMTEIEDELLEQYVRGSNLWCDSNIRTWLNSEKENVVYQDQAPTAAAMSEKKNGYSNEAGFLHGFTEEERAVLREMSIFTIGNILMDSVGTETDDRVFLLSQEELEWFGEADISIYAAPTENAVEQDQTGWYEGYSLSLGVAEYPWLLRDPAEGSTSRCRAVGNGNGCHAGEIPLDILDQIEAGVEGFGIRPAICVDRQALAELIVEMII